MAGRTDLEQLVYSMSSDITKLVAANQRALATIKGTATEGQKHLTNLDKSWGKLFGGYDPGKAIDSFFSRARFGLIEEGGARIGLFGSALEDLGPAGLIAGAGLAAAFIAMERTKDAIEYAENVEKMSKALHTSTDAVQEWAFAFKASGVDVQAGDGALQEFSVKLGQASAGAQRAQKFFGLIGISPAQVKSYHDTSDALRDVIQHIGELKSTSAQDAAIEGLGLGAIKTMVLEGSGALDELFDKARSMGAVIDTNLIHKGAEAAVQYKELSQVIDVQLKSAFIDLAPVLIDLLSWAAKFARAVAAIVDNLRAVENASTSGLESRLARIQKMQADPVKNFIDKTLHPGASDREKAAIEEELDYRDSAPDAGPITGTRAAGSLARPHTGGAHAPSDENAQALDAAEKEEIGAHKSLLQVLLDQMPVWADQAEAIQALADMDKAAVAAEQKQADDRAAKALAGKHITQATHDQVVALDAQTASEKMHAIDLQTRDRLTKQALAAQAAWLAIQSDIRGDYDAIASIQSSLAKTSKERLDIELRTLALDQQLEREKAVQELNERAANEHWTEDQLKSQLAAKNGALDDKFAAQRQQVQQNNLNPVDAGRKSAEGDATNIAEGVVKTDDIQGRYAAMYAQIDRMQQQNLLSFTEAERAKAQISAQYTEERLQNASTFFGNLATLSNSSNKKIAAIGKAAAIMQATIDGYVAIQKALASAPPPINFALAAAVGVATAANVAHIAGVAGFETGGYTGDGGRSQVAGVVHGREFVNNADSTRRNRPLLEYLNAGGSLNGAAGRGVQPQKVEQTIVLQIAASEYFDARVAGVAGPIATRAATVAAYAGAAKASSDSARRARQALS